MFAIIPSIRICTECLNYKSLEFFTKDARCTYNRRRMCKSCTSARRSDKNGAYSAMTYGSRKRDAPYLALARLIRDNPRVFEVAANANLSLYKQYLKEELDRIEHARATYNMKLSKINSIRSRQRWEQNERKVS